MGIIKKDAVRITLSSYAGMFLGYFNKAFLFMIFLTTDEIGLLNLILSVGLLFAQFCNLGTVYSVVRFFPFFRNKKKNNHGFLQYNLLMVTIGVFLFTFLAVYFKGNILHYYSEKSPLFVYYYYWFLPVGIAYIYFMLFESYLKMIYDNFFAVLMYEVILRVVTTFAILAYGFKWINFDAFVKISTLIFIVPTVGIIIYLIHLKEFNVKNWRIKISKRFRKILLKFSLISYINTIGQILITTIDALMIASFLGLKETGIYTTVVFITSFLQVPYRSLVRISNPIVSNYWKERDMEGMQRLYQKTSSVLLIISTSLFMYIWINRENAFYILKPEFLAGISPFLFLMIGRLTDMYMGLNGMIFSLSKKFSFDLIFTFVLIILVFTTNLYLIPRMGMTGAAIGTMISILIYNFGRMLFIWRSYKLYPFTRNQLVVLLVFAANLIMYEFMPHFDNRWLDMIIRCILMTVTYPLLMVYLKLEPELNNYLNKLVERINLRN